MINNFERKTQAGCALGLQLRTGTPAHLGRRATSREYLVIRYAPSGLDVSPELKCTFATRDEVAERVVSPVAVTRVRKIS